MIYHTTELYHHGILGMHWGIRRYQNPDGTLTQAGRARLYSVSKGHSKAPERHFDPSASDSDYVIKKGQKANQVIKWDEMAEGAYRSAASEKQSDDWHKENKHSPQFFSVDGLLNRGVEGKEFYAQWFGDNGWQAHNIRIDDYEFKKDVRVANGKKVINVFLNKYGDKSLSEIEWHNPSRYKGEFADYSDLSLKDAIKNMSNEAGGGHGTSRDARFFDERRLMGSIAVDNMTNRISNDLSIRSEIVKELSKEGYQAMEDVHDRISDFPVIVFDPDKSLNKTTSEYGEHYYTRKYGTKFV